MTFWCWIDCTSSPHWEWRQGNKNPVHHKVLTNKVLDFDCIIINKYNKKYYHRHLWIEVQITCCKKQCLNFWWKFSRNYWLHSICTAEEPVCQINQNFTFIDIYDNIKAIVYLISFLLACLSFSLLSSSSSLALCLRHSLMYSLSCSSSSPFLASWRAFRKLESPLRLA